mgnify:FL=1
MGCLYCEKNEKMQSFTYPVCELSTSDLYLNREQSYPGRCILVLRRHAEEFCELTKEERAALQEDLARVTAALKKLYQPGKINLGVFGDTVRHFHIHIVLKYADGLDWNGIFQMNANAKYPEEKDLEAAAKQLREEISGE